MFTVRGVQIAIWSGLECNIAIICACIPALRPMLHRFMPGLINSSAARSGQISHGQSAAVASRNRDRNQGAHADQNHSHDDDSSVDVQNKGITVQQSFELNTIMANDDDSERNLVMTTGFAQPRK